MLSAIRPTEELALPGTILWKEQSLGFKNLMRYALPLEFLHISGLCRFLHP
jgi:hypothetical protein